MDNFSKNASKFFENGITIESINNFIISGIKKEAYKLDIGD